MKEYKPLLEGVLIFVALALIVVMVVSLQWCAYSGVSESNGHDPSVLEFVGLKMLTGR